MGYLELLNHTLCRPADEKTSLTKILKQMNYRSR